MSGIESRWKIFFFGLQVNIGRQSLNSNDFAKTNFAFQMIVYLFNTVFNRLDRTWVAVDLLNYLTGESSSASEVRCLKNYCANYK